MEFRGGESHNVCEVALNAHQGYHVMCVCILEKSFFCVVGNQMVLLPIGKMLRVTDRARNTCVQKC